MRAFGPGARLRRSRNDDAATAIAAFGTQVDDPVGFGDNVQVVFDDDDTVAGFNQAVQDADEFFDISHVQPDCRFVQHVERAF